MNPGRDFFSARGIRRGSGTEDRHTVRSARGFLGAYLSSQHASGPLQHYMLNGALLSSPSPDVRS